MTYPLVFNEKPLGARPGCLLAHAPYSYNDRLYSVSTTMKRLLVAFLLILDFTLVLCVALTYNRKATLISSASDIGGVKMEG